MLLPLSLMAQYTIYPVPQQQQAGTGTAAFTQTVNVVAEAGIDQYTRNRAAQVLGDRGLTVQFGDAEVAGMANVLLGVNGSGGAADAAVTTAGLSRTAFEQANKYDRHLLSLAADGSGNARVLILGETTDATFCGLASLEQILDNGTAGLAAVTINDWADLKERGIIEGYYGVPYSAEVIKDLFRFMARYKMNTFMYGAKTDVYHSTRWADPYPTSITEEQKKLGLLTQDMLRDIVSLGHEMKVSFIWAIHPGSAFTNSSNTTVVPQIENKFKLMYELGVRQFGIFVDDVGVPTDDPTLKLNADRVTEVQNWIDEQWNTPGAEPADTVKPLHFVPQLYAYSWEGTDVQRRFYGALAGTPSKVQIYITGEGVWTVPNSSNLNYIKGILGREPAWWWNYPCNDNDNSKLFPADMYTNFEDETNIRGSSRLEANLTGTKLLISNPMQQGAVSKIALFSIADYSWNTAAFDHMASWEASLPAVVGKDKAAALKTLVPYLRYYDSSALSTLIASYKTTLNGGTPGSDDILARFTEALNACRSLIEMKDSPDESQRLFYEDAAPWLNKVRIMLENVNALLGVADKSDDTSEKWDSYVARISDIDRLADSEEILVPQLYGGLGSGNSIGYIPAEPANQALLPFVTYMKENALGKNFFPAATATKPVFVKSVETAKANVTYLASTGAAYLTVSTPITLEKNDYIGLSLPQATLLKDILVTDTLREKVTVLWSENGKKWNKLAAGVPEAYVKYVLLQNENDAPYSLKLSKAAFSLSLPTATTVSTGTIPEADIYEDHTAARMYDGDPATYTCIYRNQQAGDAYTLTLKDTRLVGDVRIYMGTTNDDYPSSARVQASADGQIWKNFYIKGTSNSNYTLAASQNVKLNDEVTYCDFEAPGAPMQAKYVRLYLSGPNTSKWCRLYEIEVNRLTDAANYCGAAVDGDGLGLDELTDAKGYTAAETQTGTIVYHFRQMSLLSAVSIYQDASVAHSAVVSVTTDGEQWTEIGPLTEAAQTIDMSTYADAQAVRIAWTGTAPRIYEIVETLDESQTPPVTSITALSGGHGDAALRLQDGRLVVEGNVRRVEVYTLDGRRVLAQAVTGGSAVLPRVNTGAPCIVKLVAADGSVSTYKVM